MKEYLNSIIHWIVRMLSMIRRLNLSTTVSYIHLDYGRNCRVEVIW